MTEPEDLMGAMILVGAGARQTCYALALLHEREALALDLVRVLLSPESSTMVREAAAEAIGAIASGR